MKYALDGNEAKKERTGKGEKVKRWNQGRHSLRRVSAARVTTRQSHPVLSLKGFRAKELYASFLESLI